MNQQHLLKQRTKNYQSNDINQGEISSRINSKKLLFNI